MPLNTPLNAPPSLRTNKDPPGPLRTPIESISIPIEAIPHMLFHGNPSFLLITGHLILFPNSPTNELLAIHSPANLCIGTFSPLFALDAHTHCLMLLNSHSQLHIVTFSPLFASEPQSK